MPKSSPITPQTPHPYPSARWFTEARRAGLLTLLPAEVWHTLSALLSFTSHDGARRFTIDQLAAALGQSRPEALRRLDAAGLMQWRDRPLLTVERDADGEIQGASLESLDAFLCAAPPPSDPSASKEIPLPPDLLQALTTVGLNRVQIDNLAKRFPEAELRQQLQWLPARGARNPAALFIRAVEQGWTEPKEDA